MPHQSKEERPDQKLHGYELWPRSEFPIHMVDQYVLKPKDTQEIPIVKTTQGVHLHEQPVYIYKDMLLSSRKPLS